MTLLFRQIGITIMVCACIAGCSMEEIKHQYRISSMHIQAYTAMQSEDYAEAISLYERLLAENPHDERAHKGLGMTYFRMREARKAIMELEQARTLDPKDSSILLHLGLTYELTQDYGNAIESYKEYLQRNPLGSVADRLKKEITLLSYREATRLAKEAIEREKSLSLAAIDADAIAVSCFGDTGATARIKPLRKAIAAMIITDLSKVDSLKVLERVRIQKLLEEMERGMTGVVDRNTAARKGKLLGAGKIVTGNMIGLSKETMRIDSLLTDVPSDQDLGSQDARGGVERFFELEKAIVFGILDDLSITLSGKQREILNTYATTSYPAIIYFGEGLDAQDRGDWDLAIEKFKRSHEADPQGPGKEALERAPSSAQASTDVASLSNELDRAATSDSTAHEAASRSGGGGGCGGCSGESGGASY